MPKELQVYSLDINDKLPERLTYVQFDHNSRMLQLELTDRVGSGNANGDPLDLTDCMAVLICRKPSGNVVTLAGDITDAENGQVQFTFSEQALAEVGSVKCQVVLIGAQVDRLSTLTFYIDVVESIAEDVSITSSSEFSALTEALAAIQGAVAGTGTYVHIRYSHNSSGSNMSPSPSATRKYIGFATTVSPNAPTDPSEYVWSRYIGDDAEGGSQPLPADFSSEISSNNLFDKDNLTFDGGYTLTNYIPIKEGQKYATNLHHTNFSFYDADKNPINTLTYITNPVIVTGNGGYLRINLQGVTDYNAVYVLEGTDADAIIEPHTVVDSDKIPNLSKWNGKRWLLIGDSQSTDRDIYASVGYGKLVSRDLGMILTNIAVSGRTMADANNWVDDLTFTDYDLVTVMSGANDEGYNCPIGDITDAASSNGSFYARCKYQINAVRGKMPHAILMMITPLRRAHQSGNLTPEDDWGYHTNALQKTTKDYGEAIINICKEYCVPYVDLYDTLDPRYADIRAKYFISTSDGCHANNTGHAKFIAPLVRAAIEAHAPYVFAEYESDGGNEQGGGGDEPTPTNYTITNNLTNVTTSNNATSVQAGSSYTAMLTAADGYIIGTVSVTMGGNTVSGAYSNGMISIDNVTGDIIIIANAQQVSSEFIPDTVSLLHSYDFSAFDYENDTTAEDLAGNFDLTYITSGVRSKFFCADRTSDFGFDRARHDFTIFLAVTPKIYASTLFETGITAGQNIAYMDYSILEGRFSLSNQANGGVVAAGVGLNYYTGDANATGGSLTSLALTPNVRNTICVQYDSSASKATIVAYINSGGELSPLGTAAVENISTHLMFDGLNIKANSAHCVPDSFRLYSGLVDAENIQSIAAEMLGIE